ncbi:aconitate hydratase AcnA [Rhabdochlamydiaceae symbiont of Dictyostelium giganteum]|uniref:aconitate hydratase AcnA n=1 Tax=Rhabdochlamydiaceae symbiont of Dictyostelium giganteum TaxID=3342349 RepID=UPI0038503301
MHDHLGSLKQLPSGEYYYSLKTLGDKVQRLPLTLRIMLESLLRHYDGVKIQEKDIESLINWNAKHPEDRDIPLMVSRVILQDLTGVPLLADLAAMRDAAVQLGLNPSSIEPKVPVHLVVDHSVQVDSAKTSSAFATNIQKEFQRNQERYTFLKWGQEAFKTFQVVPPGVGIVHQVNLETLATCVVREEKEGKVFLYPDTLVGTDSHTTMINGIGVLGWGVGGIEAESAMLGLPMPVQLPEVVGFYLTGKLKEEVTSTDLTLTVTEYLRKAHVVGKFIEFFGEGVKSLSVADRATIANMAPEYGATVGFFPCDDKTLDYLRMTGREESYIQTVKNYLTAQHLFGVPEKGDIDYTEVMELDLHSIIPSVAGPKRPQDRIPLNQIKKIFQKLILLPISKGGYGKSLLHASASKAIEEDPFSPLHHCLYQERIYKEDDSSSYQEIPTKRALEHGSIVIAAITSCTNTSNPSVMIAAGLLAKKAVQKGLSVPFYVKTSLAPGSRVVTDYLDQSGLSSSLDQLGFQLVAYGCTTCIGNSGPLPLEIEEEIVAKDLIVASVLSGNRNFEARIHSSVKANFLMSPPLVVAFALAGRVDINFSVDPLGVDKEGLPIFLKDIWPSKEEIEKVIQQVIKPDLFRKRYRDHFTGSLEWEEMEALTSSLYPWSEISTYIQKPPFFRGFTKEPAPLETLKGMRPLALFKDSITTDHISPAGAFSKDSAAGTYLLSKGVKVGDFNSYGSRRGNHHVMVRGTFANIYLKNQLVEGKEGGFTKLMPEGKECSIFEASEVYQKRGTPLIILAGRDYGMGSSRDWAAKGSKLLGVKVVIAESFERIHRSNLIGMGILPLQFKEGESWSSHGILGHELFSLEGLEAFDQLLPHQEMILNITEERGVRSIAVTLRLDNKVEIEYYRHGGILNYVLRDILHEASK